ncbi:MAG: diacylglycerol kinase [Clostridia bacterium]|nr:diacylglycerol kinase [Clostridia bacterium]
MKKQDKQEDNPILEERNEEKQKKDERLKNKNFIDSWKNAFKGIIYATTTQQHIKQQLIIAIIVVIISLFFNLNKAEFLCFLFTIVLIIFAEMVNTAIETVVDLYVDVYHPKAKIAKDVAAGGVVIATINALIVAYFLFFDKIADIGLNFIENVANTPSHLAFSVMITVMIAALALIAYAKTNRHRGLNNKFVPSGHATIAFAANTIIWILANNAVILILSLVMAILVSESRIAAKEHKLSEIIFSACLGTALVLIAYAIVFGVMKLI